MKKHLFLLLCTCGGVALAADDDITFHGTLVAPPVCAISDGKTLEVEFRDLIIDSINGDYGRKEVEYDLSCDSDTRDPEWIMTLTWTGTPTAYNNAAIETDWICPYISRHLLSLNPLQARCRRYSRG
ncbi:hypothetical protein C9Z68_02855, partial [Escherichia coli]